MTNETDRQAKGRKMSILMAVGNLCLSIFYFIVGTIGNSIAVISEGVDNLIDACSSLLILLGFKISGRGKDKLHPNGHGRIEYIVGFIISEIILFAAFTLGKESAERLLNPEPVRELIPILLAAVIGTAVKLAMAGRIEKQNLELKSSALEAYRKNVLADIKGIILVGASPILQQFTALPVDGIAGMIIAVMIAADGVKSLVKNVSLLLGEGLSKEETEDMIQLIRPYGTAIQLESFEVHDYGPEEKDVTMVLTASPVVPYADIQQMISDYKAEIKKKLDIQVCIYIDGNQAKEPVRNYAVQSNFETIRRYIRALAADRGRGRRSYHADW